MEPPSRRCASHTFPTHGSIDRGSSPGSGSGTRSSNVSYLLTGARDALGASRSTSPIEARVPALFAQVPNRPGSAAARPASDKRDAERSVERAIFENFQRHYILNHR